MVNDKKYLVQYWHHGDAEQNWLMDDKAQALEFAQTLALREWPEARNWAEDPAWWQGGYGHADLLAHWSVPLPDEGEGDEFWEDAMAITVEEIRYDEDGRLYWTL